MASLVNQNGVYGLVWTDSSRKQSQTRETLKTSNKTEAKRKKARLEALYYEGEHDPWKRKWYQREQEDTYLLSDAVEQFIRHKSRARGQDGWSDTIAKNETYTMRKFAKVVGDKLLSDLSKKDLEDFYYRPKVNSDHTRNSLYISVNTFLNWCIDQGYINEKPVFKPKKPQSKLPKFIKIEDFATLLEAQPLDWVRYGWMILAGTGMRPKELANLTLQHVEEDSILIGGDFTTKVRAERRVPLLFESKYAVEQLTKDSFDREYAPDYLLGRKPSHTKQTLSRKFTASWNDCFANKPKRVLYNLKDFFCVRFLCDDSIPTSSGMKLNDLKEILGHASLETTQKYLKAIPFGTKIEGSALSYLRSAQGQNQRNS